MEGDGFRKMVWIGSCRDLGMIIKIRFLLWRQTVVNLQQINDMSGTVVLKDHSSYCGRIDYRRQRAEAKRPVGLFVTTQQR